MDPNGAEAVRLAKEKLGHYNFCIMDVSMPIMNGIEATRQIINTSKYFPILCYSADLEMRDHCLQAGMDDFILKLCAPETLQQR
jgi:CheY-like chemotaxis protein